MLEEDNICLNCRVNRTNLLFCRSCEKKKSNLKKRNDFIRKFFQLNNEVINERIKPYFEFKTETCERNRLKYLINRTKKRLQKYSCLSGRKST